MSDRARLFVTVWPDANVTDELAKLPQPVEDGVRWSPSDNWHVTLCFIGDASPALVIERLTEADLPVATLRFGPAVERLGDRILMVPVDGADELAAAVRDAVAGIAGADQYRFRGHLTIARSIPNAASSVVGAAFEASMAATEIALVASETRPDGAVYRTLSTFSLTERP